MHATVLQQASSLTLGAVSSGGCECRGGGRRGGGSGRGGRELRGRNWGQRAVLVLLVLLSECRTTGTEKALQRSRAGYQALETRGHPLETRHQRLQLARHDGARCAALTGITVERCGGVDYR